MSTGAALTAKLLLKDGTISTLLDHVEESEVQAVSDILSVFHLCLFYVSNRTKVAVSRLQQSAEEGKREE